MTKTRHGNADRTLVLPLRTRELQRDAVGLERSGYFSSALLMYSHFLEQMLLLPYLSRVENKSPSQTKETLEEIMKTKDDGNLTFGKIIRQVEEVIPDEQTKQLCAKVKQVRDTVVAHFFFVAFLDPTNRTKRGFSDVNNYRKLIRRMCNLVKDMDRIEFVEDFLSTGSPFVRLRLIQHDGLI